MPLLVPWLINLTVFKSVCTLNNVCNHSWVFSSIGVFTRNSQSHLTCHWKLCMVTYWRSGEYQKKELWNSLYSFCWNISKNKGFCSKTSIFKSLTCNWFCSLSIGHRSQSKCIDLMACTMQSIGSGNKLSSSDSVNEVSSSASVTSIHSKKLSNQFSELWT